MLAGTISNWHREHPYTRLTCNTVICMYPCRASKPATILQIVQQEEETVLLRAMQEHRDNPQVEDAWLADADDDAAAAAASPAATDQPWQTSLPPRSPRPAGRRRNEPQ